MTSNYSASVPLSDGDSLFVSNTRNVIQLRPSGADATSLSLSTVDRPLFDATIVYSETSKLWAVYTLAALGHYVYGVLGGDEEAASLSILNWDTSLQLASPSFLNN